MFSVNGWLALVNHVVRPTLISQILKFLSQPLLLFTSVFSCQTVFFALKVMSRLTAHLDLFPVSLVVDPCICTPNLPKHLDSRWSNIR